MHFNLSGIAPAFHGILCTLVYRLFPPMAHMAANDGDQSFFCQKNVLMRMKTVIRSVFIIKKVLILKTLIIKGVFVGKLV